MSDRDLYSGLIRLHILHHAAIEPVYGTWIKEELEHHGYSISPGTLYPMLQGLEKKGYLQSKQDGASKRSKRFYSITPKGQEALEDTKGKVQELFGELMGH